MPHIPPGHDAELVALEREAARAWFGELAASSATAGVAAEGEVAMVERTAPGGAMTPLHRRSVTETYRVLDGEVTFYVGDETIAARRGDVVVAPAGTPRTLRAESSAPRWLVITRVNELGRFQDFGRAVAPPTPAPEAGWPSPAEEAAVAAIGRPNGIELLGPPGALPSAALHQVAA